jgi:hypothetical protein
MLMIVLLWDTAGKRKTGAALPIKLNNIYHVFVFPNWPAAEKSGGGNRSPIDNGGPSGLARQVGASGPEALKR